ncbi:PaaI family thioesterase [Blattabacterium cuenoti]|uniref:PaaI family thioesterase n=1 Tax=Blattabacterium cuenoti TaxID=1653831 RepID=UPI00163C21D8|nr:hotdog fold thioesterase [Blattabacterium cuenoti]
MIKNTRKLLMELNRLKNNNFLNILNIKFIFISSDIKFLIAKIPIRSKLLNPFGYLHGGVIVSFAESVGCSLSFLNLKNDEKKFYKFSLFNIEISSNHVQYVKKGFLLAEAEIFHKGKMLHLVKCNIFDEKKNTISFCKMTNLIIKNNILR